MRAIAALMAYYNHKTQAAALVMRFGYDHNPDDLKQAEPLLAASVDDFARLTQLTDTAYRGAGRHGYLAAADSRARRTATNHWRDLLPVYRRNSRPSSSGLAALGSAQPAVTEATPKELPQVAFTLAPGGGETFSVKPGEKLYIDAATPIVSVAPELNGLTGIRVSTQQQTPIHFTLCSPRRFLSGSSSHRRARR